MAIVSECQLGEDATWEDFIKWTGIRIGTWPFGELMATMYAGEPEFRTLARAELKRREGLET